MKVILALALLIAPAWLQARAPREIVEIKEGEPVSIRPDRAYILFRIVRPDGVHSFEPIFMRIPTAEEMNAYRAARREAFLRAEPELIRKREAKIRRNAELVAAGKPPEAVPPPPTIETFNFVYDEVLNVRAVDHDHALVKGSPESVYLVEVPPGDYVLYGVSYGSAALKKSLFTCMCLGTVGYSAPAGTITDLGRFYADMVHRKSSIPELEAESGFGPSSFAIHALIGATVRPVEPGAVLPEVLRGLDVRPADYRAVGKYFDPRALSINRLVPVPGVLAYDEGRVIDVKTGREALGSQ